MIFAGLAILSWAISAQVVTKGLKTARNHKQSEMFVILGLCFATISGATLSVFMYGIPEKALLTNPAVIFGGLLTFLVGTGVYYFTSIAQNDDAAMASQYANAKPIVTILGAALIFGESLNGSKIVSAILVVLGFMLIFVDTRRRDKTTKSAMLGAALALCWSVGELFTKEAIVSFDAIRVHSASLVICAFCSFLLLAGMFFLFGKEKLAYPKRDYLPFVAHGVLSFNLGYLCFFLAIGKIGLSDTIIVTAFWPLLALVISLVFRIGKIQHDQTLTYLGMGFFLLASIVYSVGRLI